jgi:hypothetical protein
MEIATDFFQNAISSISLHICADIQQFASSICTISMKPLLIYEADLFFCQSLVLRLIKKINELKIDFNDFSNKFYKNGI